MQISLPVSLYSLCYTVSSINFVCLVHIPYALKNSNLSSPKKDVFLGPTSVWEWILTFFSKFKQFYTDTHWLIVIRTMLVIIRACLHDSGATFARVRVYSGSLSWRYICLHDTTTKCHVGTSHPGMSSPRFLCRGENFTPVRNLARVSCKGETTTSFGMKSVCR